MLGVAAAVKLAGDGTVEAARVVFGAVASHPVATEAAAQLVGKPLTDDAIEQVADAAFRFAKPLDNTDFHIGWRKAGGARLRERRPARAARRRPGQLRRAGAAGGRIADGAVSEQSPSERPATGKSYDPVAEYLKGRDCPSHVVKAGLKGLVMTWDKVVHELVFDGYRYGLRDFVNDLDRRDILAGAVAFLTGGPDGQSGPPRGSVPEALRARMAAADKRFLEATHAASRCLLDEESATERGVSAQVQWWYFRIPRRHRANFARDLEVAGIAALPDTPPSAG